MELVNKVIDIYVDYILREPVARALDLQRVLCVNKRVFLAIKGFCEEKLRNINMIDTIYNDCNSSYIIDHREQMINARFALSYYNKLILPTDIVNVICDKMYEIGLDKADEMCDFMMFAGREYVMYIRWLEYKLLIELGKFNIILGYNYYRRSRCETCTSFIGMMNASNYDRDEYGNNIQYNCHGNCCVSGCTIRCYYCGFDNIDIQLHSIIGSSQYSTVYYMWEFNIKCKQCKRRINNHEDRFPEKYEDYMTGFYWPESMTNEDWYQRCKYLERNVYNDG